MLVYPSARSWSTEFRNCSFFTAMRETVPTRVQYLFKVWFTGYTVKCCGKVTWIHAARFAVSTLSLGNAVRLICLYCVSEFTHTCWGNKHLEKCQSFSLPLPTPFPNCNSFWLILPVFDFKRRSRCIYILFLLTWKVTYYMCFFVHYFFHWIHPGGPLSVNAVRPGLLWQQHRAPLCGPPDVS